MITVSALEPFTMFTGCIKAYLVLKPADQKAFISNCFSSRGLSWDIIVALRCQTIDEDKINKILGCGNHTAFSLNAFVNVFSSIIYVILAHCRYEDQEPKSPRSLQAYASGQPL